MNDYGMFDDQYCDNCEMDFCDLIGRLVRDIQHLESKVVFLRYSLSKFLPEYDREMLRCDIFADLYGNYFDQMRF
jgi:hypothetical protein